MAQQQAVDDGVKVAQAQLNVAHSLVAANQAQVQQFTAAMQTAQIDLDHTNIKAPVDGVVGVSRTGSDTGSTTAVSASGQTTGQRTMGRVVLSVDIDGKPKEFASGPDVLPFDQAVHLATKSLLDWIRTERRP